jgi:hypothetical protein
MDEQHEMEIEVRGIVALPVTLFSLFLHTNIEVIKSHVITDNQPLFLLSCYHALFRIHLMLTCDLSINLFHLGWRLSKGFGDIHCARGKGGREGGINRRMEEKTCQSWWMYKILSIVKIEEGRRDGGRKRAREKKRQGE